MGRLRKTLLGLVFLSGLVLAAAVILRETVLESAARLALSSRGFGNAAFEVVSVGPGETVIANASLGPGLPGARRLRLSYDVGELLSGRLRGLRIEGLRADARGEVLARLTDLVAGEGVPPVALQSIEIEDAAIRLGASETGVIAVDGRLDLSRGGLRAALEVGVDLKHTTAAFTLRSGDIGAGGAIEIAGGGESDLAGIALPGAAGVAATGGQARFTVDGTLRMPPGEVSADALWQAGALSLAGGLRLSGVTTPAGPGRLSADLGWEFASREDGAELGLTRPARLVLRGMAPGMLAPLALPDGDVSVTLSASGPVAAWSREGDGGVAELAGDITLAAGDARAEMHAAAMLRHDGAWRLAAPVELALRGRADGIAISVQESGARLRAAQWDAAGTLSDRGELELKGPVAAEMTGIRVAGSTAELVALDGALDGALGIGRSPGRWMLSAAPGLTVAVEGAVVPGRLEMGGPVLLTVERLEGLADGAEARVEVLATVDRASGALVGADGPATEFADASGRIALSLGRTARAHGELRIEDAQVMLPGEALGLSAVRARLPLGAGGAPDEGVSGEVALSGEVRDRQRSARFAPFRVDLEGERDAAAVSVSGSLEMLGRGVRLPLKGSADLTTMSGRIIAGPARLRFRKGGLQPGALSRQLAALRDVSGAVRVTASAGLEADGTVRTAASLTLDEVSARIENIEVAGLVGKLALRQLAPVASAGPQRLTARRLIAGVPIENPRIRLTILPRHRGMAVQIHELTGEIAGGEIAVADARWDSTARSNALDVGVRGVAIDRLLRDWRIEGVSGSGTLSGLIPVRVGPAGFTIPDGRLDAADAGVIRVDWGSARETLVNSGEQVALMVNALEDFRYDALSVGINQPESGVLTLAVGLEGANPAVLDGYPFRFNINLSGELAQILEAVREGRRIGADMLQGGLGPRE